MLESGRKTHMAFASGWIGLCGQGIREPIGRSCSWYPSGTVRATRRTGAVHLQSDAGLVESPLPRTHRVHRVTKETDVSVEVNLDGTGLCDVDTGIPFLDHMLNQLSSHGLVDLKILAKGDLHIDDHHTNEDVGIALGEAIRVALGSKAGIARFGHFAAPLDESLVEVTLDFSGREYLGYGLEIPTQRVGTYDTQLVREFYAAVASNARMTLHIRQLSGINSHHIIEASFKSFARAMRMALEYDPRRMGTIPSSKGLLAE
uniref:Imidazoleglycerol-phosphate dehydratase n=1 Tax=Compsopogon caeruleus TaxID=31354 RepID=A0A7S1XFR8_9RHOD|mmetsp:Transcript_928/g.2002  ORF Transcript_928/g.2002 Transcript_928/m.2002 type:complete len:260 (+) Transcript_928:177-956(+)